MKTKTTMKEKIKTSLVGVGLALSISTLGATIYGTSTYLKPVRMESTLIPGCTIVETVGGEVTYAKYLTPKGEIGEASIPFGLERTITESLYVKHKSVPATMELRTQVYRSKWGKGSERYKSEVYVKSLEGIK
jgi:hypothetical protein